MEGFSPLFFYVIIYLIIDNVINKNQMERKKLKNLISHLKMIVDELESEIYSDISSYEFDFDDRSYSTYDDDDGYPD
jgi:surface polysaccharide O-acyltransferase-like enzyme|tara:strand:- start:646 stop:876 length:231 start_codon:yes stop_codon:yes gene_type:complete